MSRRRRRDASPMPASSAGLLRFFADEAQGFKVSPQVVVVLAAVFLVLVLVAQRVAPVV